MFSKITNISPALQERLAKALDTIRPYLETDGGDLRVIGLTKNMTLKIELLGTCSSCTMSAMTLKAGVEQAVLNEVPEIKAVEAINFE
ncbi:MAG: NifU family protein [Cyclobacteriaceae bacterium]|nr:NifU family protein [Cyclobacteriaceae bacterium]